MQIHFGYSVYILECVFEIQSIAALLAPFGNCVDVLNPVVIKSLLEDGMKVAFNYVKNLVEADFKDKVCWLPWYLNGKLY